MWVGALGAQGAACTPHMAIKSEAEELLPRCWVVSGHAGEVVI